MEAYIWIYIIIGGLGFILPWLKPLEKYQLVNVPWIAFLIGLLLYTFPNDLPSPDPLKYQKEILKLTEIAVIISLMGAGLRINRQFSISAYRTPLLLVLITMTACIASVSLLGWWFGLLPASALLLGAIFAPTDPVLASEVQVELEEDSDEEHPVQFTLTAEAGLNDGLAFPFTWLAVWIAMYGFSYEDWLDIWLLKDVLYRIVGGIVVGYLVGRASAWVFFDLPARLNFSPIKFGFLAVAMTFLVYGLAEAVHTYGFIAVFVAALVFRHYEKQHQFHKEMHDIVEQTELFLTTVILLLLGAYIAENWFDTLSLPMLGICLIFIFIIRPLFGILPTLATKMPWKQRWIVAFLGIKGIGSFFYLAFALHETHFAQAELLWTTLAFLVFISLVVHRIAGYYAKKYILRKDK